jgi:hypothetical protein
VVLDGIEDPLSEMIDRVELTAAEQASFQDREEQHYLVQPRVRRREVQVHVAVLCEELSDLRSGVGGGIAENAVQVQVEGRLGHKVAQEVTKLSLDVESVTHPATLLSCTLRPAKSTAVPWRLYSNPVAR